MGRDFVVILGMDVPTLHAAVEHRLQERDLRPGPWQNSTLFKSYFQPNKHKHTDVISEL